MIHLCLNPSTPTIRLIERSSGGVTLHGTIDPTTPCQEWTGRSVPAFGSKQTAEEHPNHMHARSGCRSLQRLRSVSAADPVLGECPSDPLKFLLGGGVWTPSRPPLRSGE